MPPRHNWLQGLEGGFDATHLTFLHGGDAEKSRKIVATLYEVMSTDFGFIVGTGRDPGEGDDARVLGLAVASASLTPT